MGTQWVLEGCPQGAHGVLTGYSQGTRGREGVPRRTRERRRRSCRSCRTDSAQRSTRVRVILSGLSGLPQCAADRTVPTEYSIAPTHLLRLDMLFRRRLCFAHFAVDFAEDRARPRALQYPARTRVHFQYSSTLSFSTLRVLECCSEYPFFQYPASTLSVSTPRVLESTVSCSTPRVLEYRFLQYHAGCLPHPRWSGQSRRRCGDGCAHSSCRRGTRTGVLWSLQEVL